MTLIRRATVRIDCSNALSTFWPTLIGLQLSRRRIGYLNLRRRAQ